MLNSPYFFGRMLPVLLLSLFAVSAPAASFRVQCPPSTITHPDPKNAGINSSEPAYTAPTQLTCSVANGCGGTKGNVGYLVPSKNVNGAIKCQQVSGGDGYATMADGTQTYMFSFGPLSGLADIAAGKPGTEFPNVFNTLYPGTLMPADPALTNSASDAPYSVGTPGTFSYNGAVGLINDLAYIETIYDISESGKTVTVITNAPSPFHVGDKIVVSGTSTGYDNTATNPTWTVSAINVTNSIFSADQAFQFVATTTGLPDVNTSSTATVASLPGITGAVDPRPIIDVGVMNGNIPAPLMAIDEDDEFFLTLTNVGMIMRPDLFEQHTIHFHGYPNASGVLRRRARRLGRHQHRRQLHLLLPGAGCRHLLLALPHHAARAPADGHGRAALRAAAAESGAGRQQPLHCAQHPAERSAHRLQFHPPTFFAAHSLPAVIRRVLPRNTVGNCRQHGRHVRLQRRRRFHRLRRRVPAADPRLRSQLPLRRHDLQSGGLRRHEGQVLPPERPQLPRHRHARSMQPRRSSDGRMHYSQPLPSIINIPSGKKALLRISDLDVTEYQTLASIGIPMHVIGYNAKLLRDQAGNNMDYYTNSITIGGGESLDVILDATNTARIPRAASSTLYTPNLDHLSNDAENFGGLMTEVRIN